MTDHSPEHADSPAGIAFIETIELALDGRATFPNGAEFVDAEQPWAGTAIAEASAEGRAVVLCTSDGRRLVLQGRLASGDSAGE